MQRLTWEDAVEDLQFVRVLPPQTQDVVLPADHLAEDQHDRDGGQANEQEEGVSPLHDIQPLFMAHHLDSRRTVRREHSCYSWPFLRSIVLVYEILPKMEKRIPIPISPRPKMTFQIISFVKPVVYNKRLFIFVS